MLPGRRNPQRPPLSLEDIVRGKSACLRNITKLLRSSRALLQTEPMHALVFYSVAVEEYGKMKWLGDLGDMLSDATPTVDIPAGLFKNHSEKLRRGFDTLPQSCRNVMHGVRLLMNSIPEPKTIWYDPVDIRGKYRARASVDIAGGTTGQFMDISDAGGIAEVTTRLEGLYVDWFYVGSGGEGQWSPNISPDLESLRIAIGDFERFLSNGRRGTD